jgi:uncharacterized membrane protein (DUF4010 family)
MDDIINLLGAIVALVSGMSYEKIILIGAFVLAAIFLWKNPSFWKSCKHCDDKDAS